jgi:hypothetical protein
MEFILHHVKSNEFKIKKHHKLRKPPNAECKLLRIYFSNNCTEAGYIRAQQGIGKGMGWFNL